jgi:integrase/recombinase XerD
MTRSTGQRRFHFKSMPLNDPAVKRWSDWPAVNQYFFKEFRQWLMAGGYHGSSLQTYGAAARTALGLLMKPYWTIDPEADLQTVREHLATRPLHGVTLRLYGNGLDKLAQFFQFKCHKPKRELAVNWDYYLGALPDWLAADLSVYVEQVSRRYRPEDQHRARVDTVGQLSGLLRWLHAQSPLRSAIDLTPQRWFDFLEHELARGLKAVTINHGLSRLQAFLRFLRDEGRPVCPRMLLVEPLAEERRLPKDVPVEYLRRLWQAMELETTATHATHRRLGIMDRAWFLLMVHSGLRTGEVRHLKLGDIEWTQRRVRIEQSKGLKDRLVYLSAAALEAVQAYLPWRGATATGTDHVFIVKHEPLGPRYCQIRLRKYGLQTGVKVTPHQLRHSCATLLLNAGAPVLSVQMILGHKHVDTTLGYARLYDGTVAADYYRAMGQVEQRLALKGEAHPLPPSRGELLALVDSLRSGTLNEKQAEAVQALRVGLLAWAEQESTPPMTGIR